MSYQYIDSKESLNNVLPKLSKTSELGLDLEFDRNSYGYGFVLCLIQIATPDEVLLIDPFEIDDLSPLWQIFENPKIQKVIHNASEDILLLKRNDCKPKNIWDTEKAAMILNHSKTGLSNLLIEFFQVELNKKVQRTNWRKRPLSSEQLQYAFEDVKLLLPLKKELELSVKRAKRESWIREEGKILEELEEKENPIPYLKYKESNKLDSEQKNRLRNFYFLREKWAESMNKPPFQVLSNELLVKYSKSKISDSKEWLNLKGMNPQFKNKNAYKEYLSEIDHKHNTIHRNENKPWYKNVELEKALKNIREKIKEEYGEQCTKLIISQTLINDILKEGSVANIKSYAKRIILEKADDIGLKLN
ncbi:MAG: ribonuclease D [Cytophagales bacterium]